MSEKTEIRKFRNQKKEKSVITEQSETSSKYGTTKQRKNLTMKEVLVKNPLSNEKNRI